MLTSECIDYRVAETVGSFTGAKVPINYLFLSKMIINCFLRTKAFSSLEKKE